MTVDATTITATGGALGAILAGVAAVVKIVYSRPRLPVAEELLEQMDELRDDVLALARWAHRAQAQAAAAGVTLEEPPEVLRSSGHRDGERRHEDSAHGWRAAVRVATGELPIIRPGRVLGPDTQPERRAQRPTPPR